MSAVPALQPAGAGGGRAGGSVRGGAVATGLEAEARGGAGPAPGTRGGCGGTLRLGLREGRELLQDQMARMLNY